jgi:hypothetical protein
MTPNDLFSTAFRTILRSGRSEPNANGYFVQNPNGATVAGPFGSVHDAWREEEYQRALVVAEKLTAEAQALAPGFGVEVKASPRGLSLWCGNDAWGLPPGEGAARREMTAILTKNVYFLAA